MKYKKYILVCLSIIGGLIFLINRHSVDLSLCSPEDVLYSGICRTFVDKADYFWPLWDFSRAAFLVGIMVIIRPILFTRLLILSGISLVITALAVHAAPPISSDFILPLEKRIVGADLSALYMFIAAIMFGWELFRKKS